jgi:hypothetical protein
VHFSNFKTGGAGRRWKDVAIQRIINRIDPVSGKARDYMRIREIDPDTCSKFVGNITINIDTENNIHEQVKLLIAAGLAQINILAGSVCRVDVISENHDALIRRFIFQPDDVEIHEKNPNKGRGKSGYGRASLRENEARPIEGVGRTAQDIAQALGERPQAQLLRRMADVVREMRNFGPEFVHDLPEGKGKKRLCGINPPQRANSRLERYFRKRRNASGKKIREKSGLHGGGSARNSAGRSMIFRKKM